MTDPFDVGAPDAPHIVHLEVSADVPEDMWREVALLKLFRQWGLHKQSAGRLCRKVVARMDGPTNSPSG